MLFIGSIRVQLLDLDPQIDIATGNALFEGLGSGSSNLGLPEVELLEIFSGYLSNTLSFMRVAGLGIAHVCLMISFFTLAEMTSGIGSVLILILGNMLVIGLEGLSAGIQALRLNYYEFFTKFFHGTGKLYTPISLGNNFN